MSSPEIQEIINSSLPTVTIGTTTLQNSGGTITNKINPHIDYDNEGITYKNSNAELMRITVGITVKDATTANTLSYWFKDRDIVDLLNVRVCAVTDPEVANYIRASNRTLNYDPRLNISTIPLKVALKRKGFRNRVTKIDQDGNRIEYFSFDYVSYAQSTTPYLEIFTCSRIDLDSLFKKAPGTLQIQADVVNELPEDLLAGNLSSNIIIENNQVSSMMPVFTLEETGEVWTGPVHQMPGGRYMTGITHEDSSALLTRIEVPNTRIQDFRITSYLDKRKVQIQQVKQEIGQVYSRGVTSQQVDTQKPKSLFSDIYLSIDDTRQARFFFSMDYDKIIEENTIFGSLLKKRGLIDTKSLTRNYCKISSLKIFRKRLGGSSETGSPPYLVASTINADTFVPLDPATPAPNPACNQVDELIVFTSEEDGVLRSNEYFKLNGFSKPKIMPSVGPPIGDISPVSNTRFIAAPPPPSYEYVPNKQIIGTIEEILNMSVSDADGIRHLSGVDKSMSSITDGYYQYRVEMEIIDKTDEYIISQLSQLQEAKDFLQTYLNEITKPGQEASFTWKVDPHIDYEQEGKVVSRRKSISTDYAKIKNSVDTYLRLLFLFTDETTASKYDPSRPENANALRDQMISLVNPRTPSGTSLIIGLMDTLISRVSDILKIKEINTTTKLSNTQTTIRARQPATLLNSSRPTISFEITNSFEDYFSGNQSIAASYNYMNIPLSLSNLGLKNMSDADFTGRIQLETNRLVDNPEEDLSIEINGRDFNEGDSTQDTDFSYVAPAIVNVGDGPQIQLAVGDAEPNNDTETYVAVNWAATAQQPPSVSRATAATQSENASTPSEQQKMAQLGVMVQVSTPNVEISISDPVNKDNKECAAPVENLDANPFPLFNRLLEEIDPNAYQTGGPYESTGQAQISEDRALMAKTIREASSFFSSTNPHSPVNNFIKNYSTWTPSFLFRGAPHTNDLSPSQGWIATTPNHLKVLSKQQILPTNINTLLGSTSDNIASQSELNLKFFMINCIEVLTGYQEDQLTKPHWQPLTRQIYNEALGTKILCRLSPYQNKVFGVTRDLKSEFTTLDSYFLLEPENQQPLSTNTNLVESNSFGSTSSESLSDDLPGVNMDAFNNQPGSSPVLDEGFTIFDIGGTTGASAQPSYTATTNSGTQETEAQSTSPGSTTQSRATSTTQQRTPPFGFGV